MNKEQWQDLYNILDRLLSDFLTNYRISREGKNKKIRDAAERDYESAISSADYHIKKNWDSFELLTGGKNANGFDRAIINDEFLLPRYFGNDMRDFLLVIKNHIETL